MKIHEATETAYKNGYEAGKRDALKPTENDKVRKKLIDLIDKSGMVENRNRCKIIADELLAAGVCFAPVEIVIRKDITDDMLRHALAMPTMILPSVLGEESVEVIPHLYEGETIFTDWHERLSQLEYIYTPGDDGPWYRADDVWACIDPARHKEVQK